MSILLRTLSLKMLAFPLSKHLQHFLLPTLPGLKDATLGKGIHFLHMAWAARPVCIV